MNKRVLVQCRRGAECALKPFHSFDLEPFGFQLNPFCPASSNPHRTQTKALSPPSCNTHTLCVWVYLPNFVHLCVWHLCKLSNLYLMYILS